MLAKVTEKIQDPQFWMDNALNNLYFFNRCIACTIEDPTPGYKNLYKQTHKALCDFVQKYALPGHKLLILMPRGWFKSSIITVGWLTQRFLKNLVQGNREQWLLNNATYANAQSLLSRMVFGLQYNPTIQTLFKEWLPKSYEKDTERWTKDAIQIAGNRVEIGSVEGNLVSKHYNGGEINDDLVNWENSQTQEGCKKVIEWWSLSQSLLMPQSIEMTIGTIWDPNDLYCHQIKEFLKMPNDAFKQPMIEWHEGTYHLFRMGCFRDPSHRKYSTFPTMFPDKKLHELERQQKGRFPGQYMNDPTSMTEKQFQRKWFHYWLTGALPKIRDTYFLVDAANKDKAEGDFTGIVIMDVGSDKTLYIQRAIQEHITDRALAKRLVDLFMEYQPGIIGIEDNKCSTIRDILELLIPEMIRDGTVPQSMAVLVESMPSCIMEVSYRGRSKELRVNNLSGWFESNKILFNPECIDEMLALQDQLVLGSTASNDDLADAAAYILDILTFPKPSDPPKEFMILPKEVKMTAKEKEEEEWGKIPEGNIEDEPGWQEALEELW